MADCRGVGNCWPWCFFKTLTQAWCSLYSQPLLGNCWIQEWLCLSLLQFTAYYRLWLGVSEEQTLRGRAWTLTLSFQYRLFFVLPNLGTVCGHSSKLLTTAWSIMLIFVITNFAFCSWNVRALVLSLAPIHRWVERWAAFTSDFSGAFSISWISLRSVSLGPCFLT